MNDIIEHHGVKGQRWGVRRYKKLRNTAIATADKYTSDREKYRKASDKADRLSDKRRKAMQTIKTAKNDAQRNKANRKLERIGSRFQKQKVKINSAKDKMNISDAKYDAIISEASKLPIRLVPQTRRDTARKVISILRELRTNDVNVAAKESRRRLQKKRFNLVDEQVRQEQKKSKN